jgi:hypothetical protein
MKKTRIGEVRRRRRLRAAGFTLPEVLIAAGITVALVTANVAALYGSRLMRYRDSEAGLMSGFMQHYVELVKALPFDQVVVNQPLSGLYSGQDGTPLVTIPPNTNWFSLNTTDWQTFHPALVWITSRSPEIRAGIDTAYVGAIAHDKHVWVEVAWDAPLFTGPRLHRRFDLLRVKDL